MEIERIAVLLVEDDEDDFFITRSLLDRAESTACALTWARSYEEGLGEALSGRYDVCLVDYRLGPMSGLDLVRTAHLRGARTPMILLTGQGDRAVDLRAMLAGAADYLVKGQLDAQLLERAIRYARERRRAEERIRTQATLLDKARDAICAHSMDGKVIYWNKSAERLTGWSADEIKALPAEGLLHRLYDGNEAEKLRRAVREVKTKGEWMGELRHRTKNGGERVVESRWSLVEEPAPVGPSILIINTDVTERRRLETQRSRSQRMESIGRLVGGIAHDLGNLLVPVLLGAEVLSQRFGQEDERTRRTLEMIHKSAERGSDMIRQVLAFARGVEGERTAVALGPVVGEVERLAEETFPPGIEVETRVPEDVWTIRGDATQVQQVLVNLCVNARDAMPEGGRLVIEAENAILDQGSRRLAAEAEPGAYVAVTVSDTGQGIAPEHLDKVFEPFFTTKKEDGKGTGLGLSTVYSIVKSHGGFAEVSSQPGTGTAFSLLFPIMEENVEHPAEQVHVEVRKGRGEGVLVVDDEPFVLETTEEALRRAHYSPTAAGTAEEAFRLLDRFREGVHVVLSDLTLAGTDGPAFVKKLKQQRPDLPVIATGSPVDEERALAAEAGADAFLAKPFTAERLCATVGRMLRKANRGAAAV